MFQLMVPRRSRRGALPALRDVRGFDEPGVLTGLTITKHLAGIAFNPTYQLILLEEPGGGGVDVTHAFGVLASTAVMESLFAFGEVSAFLTHEIDEDLVWAQLGGGWEASVLNLSLGGMLLRLRRVLTPGSSYVVKLFLEERIAIVEARVVRLSQAVSEEQDEQECFAALQFTSVSISDAACLRGYVND